MSKEANINGINLVRSYLHNIGRYPLLTHEQEIIYGKQVQQLMSLLSAKESLAQTLCREPTTREWAVQVQLTEAEFTPIVQRGQRAKRQMVEANLRLVVAIAKKYQKRGMELLDLIQEGSMGLQRGVEKFDPTKGYRFSTYAYHWIRARNNPRFSTTISYNPAAYPHHREAEQNQKARAAAVTTTGTQPYCFRASSGTENVP